MAKSTRAFDLRQMSREALNEKVVELKKELFNLRFQHATGQLESSSSLRDVRKEIARVYTVLQERNLGIVEDPDKAADTTDVEKDEKADA